MMWNMQPFSKCNSLLDFILVGSMGSIRPDLIFLLHDFLYYIAIEIKVVTQQKCKTWSYNRDERVTCVV